MHDLNTINRLNAEAFAASIHTYRAQGRYVLARYEGLHLVSIETFDTLPAAQLVTETISPLAGERVVIFAPLPVGQSVSLTRDQSEDRDQTYPTIEGLAELGNRSVRTLGDYIASKS